MRAATRSRLWTLLNHPAFNFEKESHDHLAVFLGDFHKFHANDRPVFPLYDGIDNRHAFVLQNQHRRANKLSNIEEIVMLRRNQPCSTATQFIHNRIDVHTFHA